MPIDLNGACASMMLGATKEPELDWLTLTALEPNSTIILDGNGESVVEFRVNQNHWQKFICNTTPPIVLREIGDKCQWRTIQHNNSSFGRIFKLKGKFALSGNLGSLVDVTLPDTIPGTYFFSTLFENQVAIVAIDDDFVFPKGNSSTCYTNMLKKTSIESFRCKLLFENRGLNSAYGTLARCPKLRDITVYFHEWTQNTEVWVFKLPITEGYFTCPADLPRIFDYSHIPQGWTVHSEGQPDEPYEAFLNVVSFVIANGSVFDGVYDRSEELANEYPVYVNRADSTKKLKPFNERYQFTDGVNTLTCNSKLYSPSPSTWCGKIPLLHDLRYTDGTSEYTIEITFDAPDPLEDKYLRFTAEQDGSLLRLDKSADVPELNARLEYKVNAGQWEEYTWGTDKDTPITQGHLISLPKVGDTVKWRAVDRNETFSVYRDKHYKFTGSGKISISGDIKSLLSKNIEDNGFPDYCFYGLFFRASCFASEILTIESKKKYGIECLNSSFGNITGYKINVAIIINNDIGHSNYIISSMFYGYKLEDNISVNFKKWDVGFNATARWVYSVSPSGTFTCPSDLPVIFGDSNIPHGWTVDNGKTEVTEEEILNACYKAETYQDGIVRISDDFKSCLNKVVQIDFVFKGKTYWRVGEPLPNPNRPELAPNGYYKVHSMRQTFFNFNKAPILDTSGWTFSCDNFKNSYNLAQTVKLIDLSGVDFSQCSIENMGNAFINSRLDKVGYARTQADCDKLNASLNKPTTWEFVIHPDLLNVPSFTLGNAGDFSGQYKPTGTLTPEGLPIYANENVWNFQMKPTVEEDGTTRYVFFSTQGFGNSYACNTPLDTPIDPTACTGKRQLLRDATYAGGDGQQYTVTITFDEPKPEPNVTEFWVADAVNDELNGHYTPEGGTYVNAKTGTAFWANPNPTIPSYMFVPSGGDVEYTVYPYIPEMKHPEYEGRQYCKELLAQCREYETPDMEKHLFSVRFDVPVSFMAYAGTVRSSGRGVGAVSADEVMSLGGAKEGKSSVSAVPGDLMVIAVPKGWKAMRDDGVGGKAPFDESIAFPDSGCNGSVLVTANGTEMKLYGQYSLVTADTIVYIEKENSK